MGSVRATKPHAVCVPFPSTRPCITYDAISQAPSLKGLPYNLCQYWVQPQTLNPIQRTWIHKGATWFPVWNNTRRVATVRSWCNPRYSSTMWFHKKELFGPFQRASALAQLILWSAFGFLHSFWWHHEFCY